MKTFAIAHGTDSTIPSLWCELLSVGVKDEKLEIRFDVINGAWTGKYWPDDGKLLVEQTGSSFPATLVWCGHVPPPHSSDYNEAIPWIEDQVKRGVNDHISTTGSVESIAVALSQPTAKIPLTNAIGAKPGTLDIVASGSGGTSTYIRTGPIGEAITKCLVAAAYGANLDSINKELADLGVKLTVPGPDGPNEISFTVSFANAFTDVAGLHGSKRYQDYDDGDIPF